MYREGLEENRPTPNFAVRNTCALISSRCTIVRLLLEMTHEKNMVIQRTNLPVGWQERERATLLVDEGG